MTPICLGLWKAVRRVYPNIPIHGCHFHWAQSIYRRVQSEGLSGRFQSVAAVKKCIKTVLALPLLPAEHIEAALERLTEQNTDAQIGDVLSYIQSNWIESSVWPPATWSQYQRPIRTNNDVEAWHRRFNARAYINSSPNLYQLISELFKESRLVHIQVKLVSQRKLTKTVKAKYASLQGKLFVLWGKYAEKTITTSQLLKKAAHLMTFGDNM